MIGAFIWYPVDDYGKKDSRELKGPGVGAIQAQIVCRSEKTYVFV